MADFTRAEQEAIVLKAVWAMIDDMVNFSLFCSLTHTEETNLFPSDGNAVRIFNILLTDFLSVPSGPVPFGLPTASGSAASDHTYLFYLRNILSHPCLGKDTVAIEGPTNAFATWLDSECVAPKTWLPSVRIKLDLKVQRIEFIKLCGDISKHNFTRLNRVSEKLRSILARNGHCISEIQAYDVLDDFYERFHNDIFYYHLSTIAEFLNNIRIGISSYIQPEFQRAYKNVDRGRQYRYDVPDTIRHQYAISAYYDLLNRHKLGLFFPRFTVSRYLKLRY